MTTQSPAAHPAPTDPRPPDVSPLPASTPEATRPDLADGPPLTVATTTSTVEAAARTHRRPGPDVVRAIAIFGVIFMNYHGAMIGMGGDYDLSDVAERFFDPADGPLSTRFAATFCLTAGVGVSLLTSRANTRPQRTALRWLLVRRGLLLYGFGLVFDFIWPGTILPYYGAMFALAALMFTLPNFVLGAIGVGAALIGWLTNGWLINRLAHGVDSTWFIAPGPRSPRGLLLNVFFNGTHPLFPWLAFFCAGMIVGRLYVKQARWRPAALVGGAVVFAVATLIAHTVGTLKGEVGDIPTPAQQRQVFLSNSPSFNSIVYTASALATALIAFAAITYFADRFPNNPVVGLLRRAGQLSLTIYIAHALVFNLTVDWFGWVEPAGFGTDLTLAFVVWILSLACAAVYQKRFGIGPAEFLYRRLTSLTIVAGPPQGRTAE